jgi:predicted AAA+ superfamily ATPase
MAYIPIIVDAELSHRL